MSSRLLAIVVFLISAGLYLVFAGQVSGTEAAAGIPAAGLAAAYAGLRHRGESRPMRLRGPWLRLVLSPLASVAGDVARVGVQLLRAVLVPGSHVAGTVSRQPFRPGGTGPADAGRRALVTLASSLAPNGFVLEVLPSELGGGHALLMHRLAPGPARSGPGVAGLTDWAVAFVLLLPAFAVPVAAALRGGTADRLAAVPLAGGVATILLALATFVFDQSSFIDIALCLALLTLPGTLVLALFLERWL